VTAIPHLGFIVAAYGATVLALLGTVTALVLDRRTQTRALARLSRGGETE
jgi:heme exporter protein CcmD